MDVLTLCSNDIDIFYAYNSTLKKFDDNLVKCKRTSFDVIKGIPIYNKHDGTSTDEELELKTKAYLKKVKTNIIDLAYNNKNKFEYFITLTFSDKEIGEYSHEKAIDLLKKWINNQKHQNKNMVYILVPEFHKSGRLHFHGLVGNVPRWKLEKAINPHTNKLIKINNTQIYNLTNYKLGYTTISKIKSHDKVTHYISKYATKELITLKSKKRYWYSRNLVKPKIEYGYLDTTLADYFKLENINYNDTFSTKNRDIEILTYQLPIIDIMLTSIFK